jgi:hypothetical protein
MTAEDLPMNMNYRPYKTIALKYGAASNLVYSETIELCELENDTHGLYLPCMYAILKVTGEDLLITIDLNDSKTYTLNILKNSKCILYRHKDFNILNSSIEFSYF